MQTKIVEHKQIERVLDYLHTHDNEKTLVIFDIDNTLVEPEVMITSTEWFEYTLDKKVLEGVEHHVAFGQLLDLCIEVQAHIPLKLVESVTSSVVQKVQKSGAQVLGLTSRAPAQAEITLHHLTRFGMPFYPSLFSKITTTKSDAYHHHEGVVFCHVYSKGKALVELLERHDYRPTKIIFVDDMLKNLKTMEQALQICDTSIEYVGIHYSQLEHKKTAFNPVVAERELASIRQKNS